MNFGRAFSYVTEDPEWLKKVGIAALVMLIPVIGQIVVIGWALEITRRVINHEPEMLPDWSNFGDYVSKGFQGFVISFVYLLPVFIVSGCAQTLPYLATAAGDNSDAVQMIATIISVVSICLSCFMFLYEVAVGFILPAALGNFVATGQVGAGFRFGEVIGLVRAAPGAYFMALLGGLVSGILGALGLIACVIGVLFTLAYAYAVDAHFWGQAYNAAKEAQGSGPIASTM